MIVGVGGGGEKLEGILTQLSKVCMHAIYTKSTPLYHLECYLTEYPGFGWEYSFSLPAEYPGFGWECSFRLPAEYPGFGWECSFSLPAEYPGFGWDCSGLQFASWISRIWLKMLLQFAGWVSRIWLRMLPWSVSMCAVICMKLQNFCLSLSQPLKLFMVTQIPLWCLQVSGAWWEQWPMASMGIVIGAICLPPSTSCTSVWSPKEWSSVLSPLVWEWTSPSNCGSVTSKHSLHSQRKKSSSQHKVQGWWGRGGGCREGRPIFTLGVSV